MSGAASGLTDLLPPGRGPGAARVALPPGVPAVALACAALAWIEQRACGVDSPRVHLLRDGRAVSATVEADVDGESVAWMRGVERAIASADAGTDETPWCVSSGPAKVDAPLLLYPLDGALRIDTRAPLGSDAADVLARLLAPVIAAMAQPGFALSQLELADVADLQRQRERGDNPPRPIDGDLVMRFDAMAARHADAVAVECGTQRLRYSELEAASRALAGALQVADVEANGVVALAMPRGTEAIVAMLAVLRAGAAYLPLDLEQPPERLHTILDDAGATHVISDGPAEWAGARPVLSTRDHRAAIVQPVAARADALAYVMYTSGSTGEPKGVEIPHAAVLRLVCNADYIELGPLTRMLHAAPLGFDASTLEVWGPLLNGGCVVVHEGSSADPRALLATLHERDVDTVWLTAALFNAVVDTDAAALASLSQLFAGGEALSVAHARRALQAAPMLSLRNGYGPTECTTFTCTHEIRELDAEATSVPIGRPIAGTEVRVLDARQRPLPWGAVGELCVAGPGLARGYRNRPELTAERFVTAPDGTRLYRTGDRVRWNDEGVLEFLGRHDGQVKIRGHRIELGEIEAALASHAAVRNCAVVARDDGNGRRLVAYYVPQADVGLSDLREHLAARLADYLVPERWVAMDELPRTRNGKLDVRALPAPGVARPELRTAFDAPQGERERVACGLFSELLDITPVGRDDSFFELGGNSLLATRLAVRLQQAWNTPVPVERVFARPTPAGLAQVDDSPSVHAPRRAAAAPTREPVAIVAVAGRFPGADNVEAFWQMLCEGREGIRFFDDATLDPSIAIEERRDPAYVAARGVIDGVDRFDAAFFGISPRQAELMDPQQRVFLELCWECLERGGHAPDGAGDVGVFAGMYNATYFQKHVSAHPDLVERVGAFQVMLDNEKDYIGTRVAHRLNLTGPAVAVNTACSTSLVAIVQALDALRAGRCRMALAGGVSVTCPPDSGYRYQEGAMLSPDGHTRTFDADARGTVFSDGAAVVLLKRLDDALADGDPVIAVIRGGAINNDGGHKASFTAPSSAGQAAVIRAALDDAGVDARSIGYVEAHGTATPIGDPIEIEGLTQAYRADTDARGYCAIGSLKSNVGHMVTAAGAAGLIKAALALEHGVLPPTVHFRQNNPSIDFASSPFVVNAQLAPWTGEQRRAGVSSFGVGGTNAHVVLEEAPPREPSDTADGPQLLVLSARTPSALGRMATALADYLDASQEPLADIAWTLAAGRSSLGHRACVVAGDAADAASRLRALQTARSRPARKRATAFMFPGQGATYVRMGLGLHASEPVFREALDECAARLSARCGLELHGLLASDDEGALLPTSVMQPATFAIEYALARYWMAQGVEPVALVGHSVGEFVAATLAGVFTLDEALSLVALRGSLMQACAAGAMLSVRLDAASVRARLPDSLCVAAENAPGACVVAGGVDDTEAFSRALEAEGVACRMLRTSHAFHSPSMEPAVQPFRDAVAAIGPRAPGRRIVSTSTGAWLTDEQAMSPDYWAQHLRRPVLFAQALATLAEDPSLLLLEAGPRGTLCALARQHGAVAAAQIPAVASLGASVDDEPAQLREAFGALWCAGIAVQPASLDRRARRRRVRLPTYAFERERHWVDPAPLPALAPVITHPAAAVSALAVVDHMTQPAAVPNPVMADRRPNLIARAREVLEDVAGFDLSDAPADAGYIELGLDSLMLTQAALQLQKAFGTKITFRQLMGECASLEALATWLDGQLPAEPAAVPAMVATQTPAAAAPAPLAMQAPAAPLMPAFNVGSTPLAGSEGLLRDVIGQQMQLMAQQLALLSGQAAASSVPAAAVAAPATLPGVAHAPAPVAASASDEEAALAHTRYDVKKAFGAIARIDKAAKFELTPRQREKLDAFIARYNARTKRSKDYAQQHRAHMADPRVVNGFKPLLKELVYPIVVERSKGARLWDLDGNEYIDALNGFGMSLFGWQPDFVVEAVKQVIESGYEIGPQHPLAGEVSERVCALTGFDRAALCNTGSEAVLGALRIARTVTGRETIVLFSGAYHGIVDEMIVRGTKSARAVPAAPGILRNTSEHVAVLDYGTPEALAFIREHGDEIAAVLVEPVQSRRPDLQPREFLHELRAITRDVGAKLIFDEVVTGFRSHPGGAQAVFDVRADLATYGKVVGGGYPIGVIAGVRECMDALDGGDWRFGDDSVPEVGVTYFAGTFVRHPLALAAANAVLKHLQEEGGALQERVNAQCARMVGQLNAIAAKAGAPISVKHFASVWKTQFLEDHPLQDLLFGMMRSRGIHILDGFPCFLTSAHGEAECGRIVEAFRESLAEAQDAGWIPRNRATSETVMDAAEPAVPGARLGRDPQGKPGWFVPHPTREGEYVQVNG